MDATNPTEVWKDHEVRLRTVERTQTEQVTKLDDLSKEVRSQRDDIKWTVKRTDQIFYLLIVTVVGMAGLAIKIMSIHS